VAHTAKSLFDQNIRSAEDCLALYDGVNQLKAGLAIDWVLRASVVFVVSALDTYFHDKIKYRVGHFSVNHLPAALAKFEIRVDELPSWDAAERKGNVLRNWVMEYLSTRPLQSQAAIAESLKFAGIDDLWDSIEPNKNARKEVLNQFRHLVKRRNQISHEGDRETSRRSGKKLRPINRSSVEEYIAFAKDLIARIEKAFPK
jgi:hypothetical protein